MRAPSWLFASGVAVAMSVATWAARPEPPVTSPHVLAVPATPSPAPSRSPSRSPSWSPSPPATEPEHTAAVDWAAVVRGLDAHRLAAYADPSTADPGRWLDEGCRCAATERARLDRLRRDGLALRAAAPVVRSVRVLSATEDRVVLEVTDAIAPYAVVAGGSTVARHAGRPALTWRGVLTRASRGWRWLSLTEGDHDSGHGVDRGEAG